jgi:hypothetical protein
VTSVDVINGLIGSHLLCPKEEDFFFITKTGISMKKIITHFQLFLLALCILYANWSCKNADRVEIKSVLAITQTQKSDIDRMINEIHSSNDSISQEKAIENLPAYLDNESTREYTINSIQATLKYPKSISPSSKAKAKHSSQRYKLYTSKVYENQKSVAVQKFPKWRNVQPLERLKLILEYYYKDSTSEAQLNKYWKVSEVRLLLKKMEPYKKYYSAELEFLNRYLHRRVDTPNKTPITDFLISYKSKLSNSIFLGKNINDRIKQGDTIFINDVFKGEYYFSHLADSGKAAIVNQSVKEKIRNGELIITNEVYQFIKQQLLPLSPEQKNKLRFKYEVHLNSFINVIKSSYIKTLAIDNVLLQTRDFVNFEKADSGIYSVRFSYEFLYSFLVNYINRKVSNPYLAESVVKDVFKQFALANYAELIQVKEKPTYKPNLESPVGFTKLFRIDSSEVSNNQPKGFPATKTSSFFRQIGHLYRDGKIKEIIVKKRRVYLEDKKLYEAGYISLTNGTRISFTYQGLIPFNLINRVTYNQEIFQKIYYSFFERDIRLAYSLNSPFFEFLDVLENYPVQSLAYLSNGIYNKSEPIALTINTIRLNVASGHPGKLFKAIGLKVGYQKDLDTTQSISRVLGVIKSTNDITRYADSLFSSTPLQLQNAGYNNILLDSLNKFEQFDLFLRYLYAVSLEKQANLILYAIQKDRAVRLPEKSKCNGCYDVFWCDQRSNDVLNNARTNAINGSQNGIVTNSNLLGRLSNVDILSSRAKTQLLPLGSIYDPIDTSFVNYFQISQGGKGCTYAIKFDSAGKTNIGQILKLKKYFGQVDPYFFQRYNIDLSNLSDHGYLYLARLFVLFQNENSVENKLAVRMMREGFIDLNFKSTGFDIANANSDNKLIDNLLIEHFMFLDEKTLVDQMNAVPELDSLGLAMRNIQVNSIDKSIEAAIQPDVSKINANFDNADKIWNSWFVFVGYSTNGNGYAVPIIIFSGGSIRINLALRSIGTLPVFPIPNFKFPTLNNS